MAAQQTIEQTGSQASAFSNGKACEAEGKALILRDPEILEGKPFLRGTRMGVHSLIGYWQSHQGSYEHIIEDFPHLSRELIDAAVDFYGASPANKAEIDGILSANEAAYRRGLRAQRAAAQRK